MPAVAATVLAFTLPIAACSGSSGSSGSSGTSGSVTGQSKVKTLKAGQLRVATQSDDKPYSYVDGTNDEGYTLDLVTDIAKRLGLTPQFVYVDFSAIIPSVVSGSVDIGASSISNTPARQKIINFSDPTLFGPEAIVASKDSGITSDPKTLAGKRLGVLQGTIQDDYATKHWSNAKIVRFPDDNTMYTAVKTGSVDAAFGDEPLAASTAASRSNLHIVMNIVDKTEPFAIAFNKKNPALKDAFNKQLNILINDGTVEKLAKKYLPQVPVDPAFKPK